MSIVVISASIQYTQKPITNNSIMRFFSVLLAIVFIFTYMQATSCGLVDVDADVLSKKGGSKSDNPSKGSLVGVDLDVLSSSN
ncbi:unnamed protein product [Callosobruchus maculatus]|uniref:Transmembrane protein n=1 Tax=Callosobruchus maculatus TaxID=64391 RepID=A0A653C4D7_CALMS|nr:unnamed protein product [Callosobruchus maculatus]